jgi:uncharacterized OB-fold protein
MAKKATTKKSAKKAAPKVPAYKRSQTATFQGTKYQVDQMKPGMVVQWPRTLVHHHTYGLLSPFFAGLGQGKLMVTYCPNKECEENRNWLPPRAHCPDCYTRMRWRELKQPVVGKIYSYTLVDYAGVGIELKTPYWQIDVEIDGYPMATIFKGYLAKGKPQIGDKVIARFRKGREATNSILDVYWEMYDASPEALAEKKKAAAKPAKKKTAAKKAPAKKKPAAKKGKK